MVSRGLTAPNILKGIHLSMADRLAKLVKATGMADSVVFVSGGLALDTGLVAALEEEVENQNVSVEIRTHPDAAYAGAIGAAIWGAFRHEKLAQLQELPLAS